MLEARARLHRLKRAARYGKARLGFALQHKKRLRPLGEEQVSQYHRDGCLLVSGLIPRELVSGARTAMWERLGADAHDPKTWHLLGPHPHLLREPRLTSLYTDSMIAAAAQLAGEDMAGFGRPTHAFTINNVPVSQEWRPHAPHLDYARPDLRHRTFPRPYHIATIAYLTDVARHGGGTMVYPGAHRKLEALARSDPGKYRLLSALLIDLDRLELGPPVELIPASGDVLFHHYLCAHAGSDNVSGAPRLAIGHKW